MTRRVAHFLLIPELANSPPNDALINAWLELGQDVDLYAPGGQMDLASYGNRVQGFAVSYGYRWLARNLLKPGWRKYAAFSGTTEDPLAIAGLLGTLWRRPVLTLADEIRSDTYGGPRSLRWKALCRFGMRASALTVVNEAERIELQRDYAGLRKDQRMIVYPGAFRLPPEPANRTDVRAARNIPQDALLLCYSGTYLHGNGGLWMAEALSALPEIHVWGQILHPDPLVRGLLQYLRGADRLHLETFRLGWREAWAVSAAADIGMVIYLQDGPQFQHMGIASNRLCMFLAMGVPVIASRQPSFEFLERHDCGVLIESADAIPAAVKRIASRLETMRSNALACARDYICSNERYQELRSQMARIVSQ
jgi:glycosyltransferase involved in cell wall biosynthesis